MSRLNQMQHDSNINTQLEMMRQQQQDTGIYGQMNFGGIIPTQQQNKNVSVNNAK